MNFLFLILPKIIIHKRLELFEYRQLHDLLEILFYGTNDFESRKVQGNFGLARLWWFGGAKAKTGKSMPTSSFIQLSKFPNFTNSKTRYLKGDPLGFTQKAPLLREL
jgi:hypothetical protein